MTTTETSRLMKKTIISFADQDKTLILMRGVPGSGKSTLAKQLVGEFGVIFSTDDFFTAPSGEYGWHAHLIGTAHKWNQNRAGNALDCGVSLAIIDNTNTTLKELKPYLEMGYRNNYTIAIAEPTPGWEYNAEILAEKNIHGVPQSTIEKMLARFVPHERICREATQYLRGLVKV